MSKRKQTQNDNLDDRVIRAKLRKGKKGFAVLGVIISIIVSICLAFSGMCLYYEFVFESCVISLTIMAFLILYLFVMFMVLKIDEDVIEARSGPSRYSFDENIKLNDIDIDAKVFVCENGIVINRHDLRFYDYADVMCMLKNDCLLLGLYALGQISVHAKPLKLAAAKSYIEHQIKSKQVR